MARQNAAGVAAFGRLHGLHAVSVLLDGGDLAEAEQRVVQPQNHAADRLSPDDEALRRSADRDELSRLDLEHLPGGDRFDGYLPGVRCDVGLSPGTYALRRFRADRVGRRRDL